MFLFLGIWTLTNPVWAITFADIPADAPADAVMAEPAELQAMLDWTKTVFTGESPNAVEHPVSIKVIRQDYNFLRFGESCMETPITIGIHEYQHGLGTHANSEIVVSFPAGAKFFQAFIGVDNNYNTQGQHGSVEFSVEIKEQEVFRSAVLRGGEGPIPVSVEIPDGVQQLVLKVGTTSDGPSHDQADWADAQLIMADGSILWLDENQTTSFLEENSPPFSFIYDGIYYKELLKKWERKVETQELPDRILYRIKWLDPKTNLSVSANVAAFKAYPAVEWVLYFENSGVKDTPILENIQAVDLGLRTGSPQKSVILNQIHGDACAENTFIPFKTPLDIDKTTRISPTGGRSSSISAFPFFNLQYGDQGIITAIGWSGQWNAALERRTVGVTHLIAGMEKTHLVLHPGERIRSPRMLLMSWKGDIQNAQNRFRRLMLFKYVPKINGKPLQLPIVLQTFDRYVSTRPEWPTEAGQLTAAKNAHALGCDTYWLDAAWFEGNFPNGVGNWYCKPREFPRGLKPISDLCRELGLKFVVWFEPERVAPDTKIAREHPEFVFGGAKGGLFKLNDPAARRWLTDLLLQRIDEFGLDVYRNDFNMDPLGYWRRNDAPDRQGMTEIRYIEGLYAMWDEILAKHPNLFIDNCSSGGRRIDLETCMRSVPLWRSDTSCSPGHPEWNQVQTVGLGAYVPLFTAAGWTPEPYDFRSSATMGAICQWDYLNPAFPFAQAKETMAEVKENQKYWYGDIYPLTACSNEPEQWMAYQFHRADLNAGLVYIFKHKNSPYTGLSLVLRALNPDQTYSVNFIDDERKITTKKLTGKELMAGMEIRLSDHESSMLIRYGTE